MGLPEAKLVERCPLPLWARTAPHEPAVVAARAAQAAPAHPQRAASAARRSAVVSAAAAPAAPPRFRNPPAFHFQEAKLSAAQLASRAARLMTVAASMIGIRCARGAPAPSISPDLALLTTPPSTSPNRLANPARQSRPISPCSPARSISPDLAVLTVWPLRRRR